MALLRRKPRDASGANVAAIPHFWQWWAGARESIGTAIDNHHVEDLARVIGPHVERIHRDLHWEFGQGRTAQHALVVSAGGSANLRAVAERWRRAGPPADEVWEYHPARQPSPDAFNAQLMIDERPLKLDAVVVEARTDDSRCRLDVGVYHPIFPDLGQDSPTRIAYLVLDWALGEDDVERWIGRIHPLSSSPLDPVPARTLSSLISQLQDRWGSGDRWVVLEGEQNGRPLMAMARHPMHRVDHPLFDEHVAVTLSFVNVTTEGMPGEDDAAAMRSFEEGLLARLGGSAVLVAHETSSGRRVLHFYGDSTATIVPVVQAMLGGYHGGTARVTGEPDPAWQRTAHLRP